VRAAVIGGGVVGCACALELARRGADVLLVEAEDGLGLWASGTNSGILHSGFDSVPGELETRLILRSVALRDAALAALGVPVLRCGALMRGAPGEYPRNGVAAVRDGDDLFIPGEWVTDPVAFTQGLARLAREHGARIETGRRVDDVRELEADLVVNAAGLGGGAFDGSFAVHPRKGEFFVFEAELDRILLPAPSAHTKGVLVFPTVHPGLVIAGPTAVDLDAPDWSVRAQARDEVLGKARELLPSLGEPVDSYAGLRPAGRDGANYVIGRSATVPNLLNVGAIRSTGLSASLGIAEHVAALAGLHGDPWWERAARHR
jgi:glycerol-3-phosphate dehydrogenase